MSNNVFKKAFEGKVLLSDDRTSLQEPLVSRSVLDYGSPYTIGRAFGMAPLWDARFIPSTPYSYALKSEVKPTSVSRRYRKWNEQFLVFGADLIAEGDAMDVTASNELTSTQNLFPSLNFSQTPNLGSITDTFVCLNKTTGIANDNAVANLGVYAVASGVTNTLTLADTRLSTSDGGSTYRWSQYGFYPPKLLPLLNSQGKATAYAAILPEDWPVIPWQTPDFSLTFGSALRKAAVSDIDVVNFNAERLTLEMDDGALSVGDYILLQDCVFYCEQVSPLGGARDLMFATPLPGYEVDSIVAVTGSTIYTLYTVGELTAQPSQSVGNDALGNVIPPLYDSIFLEWIRVRNLVPPTKEEPSKSLLGSFIDATSLSDIGYAPALIPAANGGGREAAYKGVSDFGSVVLDSAVEDAQNITIDYKEGLWILSHPIEDGSVLNPNSELDGQQCPILYGLFAAWNGPVVPQSVSKLQTLTTDIDAIPDSTQENTPVAGLSGWKFSLGNGTNGDYYRYPTLEAVDTPVIAAGGNAEAIYAVASNVSHSNGSMLVFQKRSEANGLVQVGALTYNGRGANNAVDDASFSFVPDIGDGNTTVTSASKPEFRISTRKALAVVKATFESSISPGDVLAGSINGVDFSIALIDDATDAGDLAGALPDGIQSTDGVRDLSEIIEDIVAKMPGTLTRGKGGDYDLYWYKDGSDYILVMEASQSLTLTTDDASLFGGGTQGSPKDLILGFGFNRIVESTLRWVERENELHLRTQGLKLNDAYVRPGHPASYIVQGFDLVETSVEGGIPYLTVGPGVVQTSTGALRIEDSTRLAFGADVRSGIYIDVSSGILTSRDQGLLEDSPFASGLDTDDVPLFITRVSSVPDFVYTVDLRGFEPKGDWHLPLTVGAQGRVKTLTGAIELAKEYVQVSGGTPKVSLLEDVTLDMSLSNTDDYPGVQNTPYEGAPIALPHHFVLEGNGYQITVSGMPDETGGFGDPLFRADQSVAPDASHIIFRNVTFILDAGEAVDASVMAGNFTNGATVTFDRVHTRGNIGGQAFHLYNATNDNDLTQDSIVVKNCSVEGSFRTNSIRSLSVQGLEAVGTGEVFAWSVVEKAFITDFTSSLTDGTSITLTQQDGSYCNLQGIRASNIAVVSSSGANTDLKASLSNIMLGNGFVRLGDANHLYVGNVAVTNLTISSTSATIPVQINQCSQVSVSNLYATCQAAYVVSVTDSDVTMSSFELENASGNSGINKVGVFITGDNGLTVNGEAEMSSQVILQNGRIVCDEGYGVYVDRRNVDNKEVNISNVTFYNETLNANAIGVGLSKVASSADGRMARNVYVTQCTFNAYTKLTSGANIDKSLAVGANQVAAGSFINVFVANNVIIGDNSTATTADGFYELPSLAGGRAAADINVFLNQ